MIVSVGLPGSLRKRDLRDLYLHLHLHRQSPARAGALFTPGERRRLAGAAGLAGAGAAGAGAGAAGARAGAAGAGAAGAAGALAMEVAPR